MRGRRAARSPSKIGRAIQARRRSRGLSRAAIGLPSWVERAQQSAVRLWIIRSASAGAVLESIGFTRTVLLNLAAGAAMLGPERRFGQRKRRRPATRREQMALPFPHKKAGGQKITGARLEWVSQIWREGRHWTWVARAMGYQIPRSKSGQKAMWKCTRKHLSRLRERHGEEIIPSRYKRRSADPPADPAPEPESTLRLDQAAREMRETGHIPAWAIA